MNPIITANLGSELAQQVRQKAQEEGKSVSQYVKEALRAGLEPKKSPESLPPSPPILTDKRLGLNIPPDDPINTMVDAEMQAWLKKDIGMSALEALRKLCLKGRINPEALILSEKKPLDRFKEALRELDKRNINLKQALEVHHYENLCGRDSRNGSGFKCGGLELLQSIQALLPPV